VINSPSARDLSTLDTELESAVRAAGSGALQPPVTRSLRIAQGADYVATGLWPVLHRRSFAPVWATAAGKIALLIRHRRRRARLRAVYEHMKLRQRDEQLEHFEALQAMNRDRLIKTVCYSATQTFAIESGTIGGTLQSKWRGQSVSALHRISQLRVSPPGAAAVTQTCSAVQPSEGHGSPSPCVEI
jgi:hypothetical protein